MEAHELCEYKLKTALGKEAQDPTAVLTHYSEEMEDCANGYAAYILELVEAARQSCADSIVLIEQRVDYSRYVAEGFGTADARASARIRFLKKACINGRTRC